MSSGICASCKKEPASFFVKKIVNNQVSQIALCAACAGQTQAGDPLDLMLQWLSGHQLARRPTATACACGMRLAQFQETGRFGCPRCYETFAPQIRQLLPQVHGGAGSHKGKSPRRGG